MYRERFPGGSILASSNNEFMTLGGQSSSFSISRRKCKAPRTCSGFPSRA